MIPDDESMIVSPAEWRKRRQRQQADPQTLASLEALPFRPFTGEW